MSMKFKLYRYPWKLFTQESEEYDEITPLEGIEEISDIYELILNDIRLDLNEELKLALEKYKLIYLGLTKCHLTTLDNLPQIPTLKRLALDFNQISSLNLDFYNDTLVSLSVMGNCLNLEGECQFTQMTALKQLSILGNNYHDYLKLREAYIESMPNLIFLDGLGRDDVQRVVQFRNQQEEARYLGWYKIKTPTLNLKDDSIEIVPKKKTKKKKDQTVRFSLGSKSKGNKKKRVKVEEPDSAEQQNSPYGKIEQSRSEHGHVKTEFTFDREEHLSHNQFQVQQLGSQINTIDFDMVNQLQNQHQEIGITDEDKDQEVVKVNKKIKKKTQGDKYKNKQQIPIQIQDQEDPIIDQVDDQEVQQVDHLQQKEVSNTSPQKNLKIPKKNIRVKQEVTPEVPPETLNEQKPDVQFIGQSRNKKKTLPTIRVKQEDQDGFVYPKLPTQDVIKIPDENVKSQAKIKRPKQRNTPTKQSSEEIGEGEIKQDQWTVQGKISQQSSDSKSNIKKPKHESRPKIENDKNLSDNIQIKHPESVQQFKKDNIKKPKQSLNKSISIQQQSQSPDKISQKSQASPQLKMQKQKKSNTKKGVIKSKTQDARSMPAVIKKSKQKAPVQSESDNSRSKSLSPVPRRSLRAKKNINYFGQA